MCEEDPETRLTVDLENQQLVLPEGQQVTFPIDGFSKHCLLNGVDQMGFLMQQDSDIVSYEGDHPPRVNTLGATSSGAAWAALPEG
jgi:3-isopropylmalate/(R)-2-methylmalate dehydratase small subunit